MSKYCSQCGNLVDDNAAYCNKCGISFAVQQGGGSGGQMYQPNGYQQQPYQPNGYLQQPYQQNGYQPQPYQPMNLSYPGRSRARIDTIFSALVHEKTTRVTTEFIMWCTVCLLSILSLVAAVLVDSDKMVYTSWESGPINQIVQLGGYQAFYIFLFIFLLGLGALLAFRLKAIALLYGGVIFQVILSIVYYVTNSGMISSVQEWCERRWDSDLSASYPVFLTILFVLALLAGIALAACLAVHLFSRINLGKIVAVLAMVQAGLMLFLAILLYVLPSFDLIDTGETALKRQSMAKEILSESFSASVFWFGSILFVLVCAFTAVYMTLFFMGVIDNKKDKIIALGGSAGQLSGRPIQERTMGLFPGLQCIQGTLRGQTMYLQGQELTIGTQPGVSILLQDAYVSHRHCSIRFNQMSGYYEVLDTSTNGVYDQVTGNRFRRGVYTSCPSGTVLCIGGMGQQFRLL